MSACSFCPAGGPPGHRGSCCPQPSTGEAGQLHQRTRAPSPGLGLCRDRSGSLADPGVLSPENPGSLIPTSRLFTFSGRERAWWAEPLCAWNHRIRSPQSSLPGLPLEGRSRGRWMAQRPHEACGSLNTSYNWKRLASRHTALGRLILPLSGPSHPTPPTPLPKKERFLTCCKESGRDTFTLHSLVRTNQVGQPRPPPSLSYILHSPKALVPGKAERTGNAQWPSRRDCTVHY